MDLFLCKSCGKDHVTICLLLPPLKRISFGFADSSPRIGDIVNSTLTVVLFYRIKRLHLEIPRSVYREMIARIILTSVAGLVPVFGAFYSRLYRCNKKNISAIQSCFADGRDESAVRQFLRCSSHAVPYE